MTLAERFRIRMDALKLSQKAVADRANVKQPSVHKILKGKTKTLDHPIEYAEALECSPKWLAFGEGPMIVNEIDQSYNIESMTNIIHAPRIKGTVPVISWVEAGSWNEADDQFYPGDGEVLLPCPANHGPHSYALRVDGDSMTSTYGKSYPSGCVIFVDPDQIGSVVSGDRVIAKIAGSDLVTFKQFIDSDGKKFLKPLNQQFPVITDKFRIIGKVIGKWEDE